MHLDEHQDWMDGFDSWEEVWPCLIDDWERVVDVRQRLEVERASTSSLSSRSTAACRPGSGASCTCSASDRSKLSA